MTDASLTPNQDAPANQFVVLDLLKDLLAYSENPGGMGSYLTRQLREFFGARIVALVQYREIPEEDPQRIIAIQPDRFRHWEGLEAFRGLVATGRGLKTATLLQSADRSRESGRALAALGVQTAIAVPLILGNEPVGCLWAVDLLETIRTADTVRTLAMLSPVVALVMRNATFFESLEEEIRIRTQDLTRRERQYRELTEAVPVGIFHLDPEGRHLFGNDKWYEITGLEGFDGGAPRFEEFIHAEDREAVQRTFRQILQTGTSAEVEFRLVRQDGQTVWVQARIVPERDEFGKVSGIIGTLADTTEKVRLAQAQAFLAQGHWLSSGEAVFQAMAGFLARHLDMDYVCIDRLVGDELEAETLAVWFDGRIAENVRYTLKDTPCGAAVGQTICCFPRGVRHRFPKDQVLQDMKAESYLATTLWGAGHRPIGLIALIGRNPIRDAQFADATLNLIAQRAARELERMDAEVDKAKLQTQLLQAQKMDSLGRLAGGVAHDMNNVLGAIPRRQLGMCTGDN